MGLNLLRLLVQNRIAEFHTELELLPVKALEHPCIKHAVELEQSFMEGAYNRVLSARQAVPHDTYYMFTSWTFLPKQLGEWTSVTTACLTVWFYHRGAYGVFCCHAEMRSLGSARRDMIPYP